MPILLQCNCGKRLKVADELAGRRGKCPACGTVLEIPAPDSTNAAQPTVAAPDPLEGLDDDYGIAPSAAVAPQPARSPYASPAPIGGGRAASPFAGRTAMGGNAARPVSVEATSKQVTLYFTGVDPNMIAAGLEGFFLKRRYKLESGTPARGVFGIGSDVGRILAGALVKRYKFKVAIVGGAQSSQLTLTKGMSGISGSIAGYLAMNRETKKIISGLRTHFGG